MESPKIRLRSPSNPHTITSRLSVQPRKPRPGSIYLTPSGSSPSLTSPQPQPDPQPIRRATAPVSKDLQSPKQNRRSSGVAFPSPVSPKPSSPLAGPPSARKRLPSYATPSSPLSTNGSSPKSKPTASPVNASPTLNKLPPSRLRKTSTISSVLSNPPAPRLRLTSEEPPERDPGSVLQQESSNGSLFDFPQPVHPDGEGTMRAMSKEPSFNESQLTRESLEESSMFDGSGSGADDTSQPDFAVRDEELSILLGKVERLHLRSISHYKRLYASQEAASATNSHALHAEIQTLIASGHRNQQATRSLREELENSRNRERKLQAELDRLKTSRLTSLTNGASSPNGGMDYIASTIFSDGDEEEIASYFRSLDSQGRTRLLHLILSHALPGDADALKKHLDEHARTHFDIVGDLPDQISLRIFELVAIGGEEDGCGWRSIGYCMEVSKKWSSLLRFHSQHLYRLLSVRLTAGDPVPILPSAHMKDWSVVYRGLYFRERNWSRGEGQGVATWVPPSSTIGTNKSLRSDADSMGVSCGKLCEGVLVLGGDETIRVFDLPTNLSSPNRNLTDRIYLRKSIPCPGPISSLDCYPSLDVACSSSSNHARIIVLSLSTGQILQKLQGHSKGVKHVAMNQKWVISSGYDKAICAYEWVEGKRSARWGQQTDFVSGLSWLDERTFCSVQADGVVRTYDVLDKTIIGQFSVGHLVRSIPNISSTFAKTDPVIWASASGSNIAMASKNLIVHLRIPSATEENLSASTPTIASFRHRRESSLGPMSDMGITPVIEACVSTPGEISNCLGSYLNQRRVISVTRSVGRQGGGEIYVNELSEMFPLAGAWDQFANEQLDVRVLTSDHQNLCAVTGDGRIYAISFVGSRHLDD